MQGVSRDERQVQTTGDVRADGALAGSGHPHDDQDHPTQPPAGRGAGGVVGAGDGKADDGKVGGGQAGGGIVVVTTVEGPHRSMVVAMVDQALMTPSVGCVMT